MNGSSDRVLSIAHLTLPDCSPPEQVSAAAEAGFHWVSLNVRNNLVFTDGKANDGSVLRETLQRLNDTGMRVHDLEGISITRDLGLDAQQPSFEAAARLGARGFTVTAREEDQAFVTDTFAEICRRAAPYGVEPNFEFFRFSSVRNLAETLAVVRAVDQPNAGVLIDTLHVGRSHVSLDELRAVEPRLIRYIQFCDCVLEQEPADVQGLRDEAINDRLLPGEGTLPLVDILNALPPNIGVSVELPNRALMKLPPVERARRVYEAADKVLTAAGR